MKNMNYPASNIKRRLTFALKTNKMKTESNTKQTMIVSIPKSVAGYTIEDLLKNEIQFQINGIDPLGNIKIQLRFEENQKAKINKIMLGMGITEFLTEFLQLAGMEVVLRSSASGKN